MRRSAELVIKQLKMVSMEKKNLRLSILMKLSWQIQMKGKLTRSKALLSAWAIVNNEDITVHYLTLKLNHSKPLNHTQIEKYGLFNN